MEIRIAKQEIAGKVFCGKCWNKIEHTDTGKICKRCGSTIGVKTRIWKIAELYKCPVRFTINGINY